MNQSLRAVLWTVLLLAITASGYAQGWALPAKTPGTTVLCTGCPGTDPSLKTVGYNAPITTFTGRYLDSTFTNTWFAPFRTARADFVLVSPALDRIYFRYGFGTVVAYKLSTFFTRLEGGEPLVFPVTPMPADRGGNPELFLRWDEFFNPELNGWKTYNIDGSIRMSGFDVDDQGYVYVASTIFGWGIVKDDLATIGAPMRSTIQKFPSATGDATPNIIAVVKGATRYYIIMDSGKNALWDVTDRTRPAPVSASVPALMAFAKNAAGDRIALIDHSFTLTINTGDGLASGAAPLFSGSPYGSITSDGTNFFGVKVSSSGAPSIAVIVPSGTNGYTVQGTYPIDSMAFNGLRIHYGDGYLVLAGADSSNTWDFRAYQVVGTNLVPTAVPMAATPAPSNFPSYFRNYYAAGQPGYVTPGEINILDGTVVRASSGNTYLILCAMGLGDVYQIQGGDSIVAKATGPAGTINPSTPTSSNSSIFYGDPVTFNASSTSQNVSTVAWNFGNPEAGGSANNQTAALGSITYQYSNLTKTTLGVKTASATSLSDSNVHGSTTVTLASPAARIKIAGTQFLFIQPNASSSAPIVVGDSFLDASDGSVESHFSSWTFDGGSPIKATPIQSAAVGACGAHSVVFDGMYGPYVGAGSALTTSGSSFPVGLDANNGAFVYFVRPFAASIASPASAATTLTFTSNSRFSSDLSVLDAAHTLGMTWKWELLNSSGLPTRVGPNGTGTSIQPYVEQKSFITANMRVRLTITTPAFIGACAGTESSVALTAPLNPPVFTIAVPASCDNGPCTFSVTPAAGVDPIADGWTYAWDIPGAAAGSYTATGGTTSSTFTPTFTVAGTYTVHVKVTNAINSTDQSAAPMVVNIVVPVCPKMTSGSFSINYTGASCSSASPGSQCTAGESVAFQASVVGSGYDPSCVLHHYKWTFPDGGSSEGDGDAATQVTHAMTVGGTVTLVVSNATPDSHTYTTSVSVGSGCQVNCGGPPACGTMSNSTLFIGYTGASCSTGQQCANGDSLAFVVQTSGYDFSCAVHQFLWNFGDGGTSTLQSPSHTFTTSGTHAVSVRISHDSLSFTRTSSVTTAVISGCGTMSNSTIFIAYNGTSCGSGTSQTCTNGDNLTFGVQATGYDLNCATHTYNWTFDGTSTATGPTPSHAFTTSGAHSVSVSIYNGSQTFVRTSTVTTAAGGTCGTVIPNITLSINYQNASNTCSASFGSCTQGEALQFTVLTFGAYDFSCATHTFDWDFGDGSPHASTKDVTHTYSTTGTFTSKCVVNNGSGPINLSQTVVITGNPITGTVTPSFNVAALTDGGGHPVPNGFIFTPSFDHPQLVTSWKWDFGDNSGIVTRAGNATNPISEYHTYQDNKSYTVTLTAYNGSSAVGTKNAPAAVTEVTKRRSVRP